MTSAPDTLGPDSYPSLRGRPPVLSRQPGHVQVGVDQLDALVLIDVHPHLRQVLALFDGRHRWEDVQGAAAALGIGSGDLGWCVQRLRESGLLIEHSASGGRGPGSPLRVRLVGAGRLGHQVAQALIDRVTHLYVADDQPPDPDLYPTCGALGSQAEAFAAGRSPSDRMQVYVLNHWSKPDAWAPDLTIVASDTMECDRVVAAGLLRDDQPHLILRAGASGAVVGPFVLPGRTACLHCTDLARRDADPAWPTLLPQLLRARAPLSATQVGWAGSVAAAQVLAYLQGGSPETLGATLELGASDHLTRWRSWPMHQRCGCGWGGAPDGAT